MKTTCLPCSLIILVLVAGCSESGNVAPNGTQQTGPPWFKDISAKVGLHFSHDEGPVTPEFFMPQIAGSGCAFLDYDSDGRLDIYLMHNGGPNGKTNKLFHQEPNGTLRDVSRGSGLDVAGFGMGVCVADIDNDDRPDVLVTEFGRTRLFHNQGDGRFVDISKAAGINNPFWGTSATACDLDRDGWLDLVIVNYLDYHRSRKCPSASGKLDFCGPRGFPGTVARVYRNLGAQSKPKDIRFEDVTVKAGLNAERAKGLGVLCADFDGDRWPDIFVANDLMANHLWINQQDGTFKEQAMMRGVAYTGSGNPAADMGIAWGDVDGNGLPDLFVTHIKDETHTLWKQHPRGVFHDATASVGLTAGDRSTGFGTAFVDFNCDGWLDLAFVNGAVARNRNANTSGPFWSKYAQPSQLFAGTGKGNFRSISASNPDLCGFPYVGRGLAVGDYDNDGAPDLLITGIAGKARLLRNIISTDSDKHHWLTVRAMLPKQKREAYGAEVTVRAGGKNFQRLLNPGYSYCSSNDPRGHFGLGANARYEAIEVLWPDGRLETFRGGPADRVISLRQGEGETKPNSDGQGQDSDGNS